MNNADWEMREKRNAKMMWRKTANSREEMPEYVERSYHEALINALVHRDFLKSLTDMNFRKTLMRVRDQRFVWEDLSRT